MLIIAGIRETERWTTANIAGAVFLTLVVIYVAYRLLRRYLSD